MSGTVVQFEVRDMIYYEQWSEVPHLSKGAGPKSVGQASVERCLRQHVQRIACSINVSTEPPRPARTEVSLIDRMMRTVTDHMTTTHPPKKGFPNPSPSFSRAAHRSMLWLSPAIGRTADFNPKHTFSKVGYLGYLLAVARRPQLSEGDAAILTLKPHNRKPTIRANQTTWKPMPILFQNAPLQHEHGGSGCFLCTGSCTVCQTAGL
eukprot:1187382-Prorocentrum_minimum.AAC.3